MSKLLLWKSDYSIGKSILSLLPPLGKSGVANKNSIFNILQKNKLNELTLVEDSVSGILEASKNAKDCNIKLIFGLRISVTDDVKIKDNYKKSAKYIIFVKNYKGYSDLIKIWSFASTTGFDKCPMIDWQNLKLFWSENLKLAVPFYDSFLFLNSLESHTHIPDFSFAMPTFFIESNDLPFDTLLKKKIEDYCYPNKIPMVDAQSIYYENQSDFSSYLTFRCITSRASYKGATFERPELSHMSVNKFNFEKTLK